MRMSKLLGFAELDEQGDIVEESQEVQVTSSTLNVASTQCRMSQAMIVIKGVNHSG